MSDTSNTDPERLYSVDDVLAAEHAHLHRDEAGAPASGAPCAHSALCLSGGGIRSATFALGLIQGLALHGVVSAFDYVSTVSGGGFAGSWLVAWLYRHGNQDPTVLAQLARTARTAGESEPEPVRRVRIYSRYMGPEMGFLSADSWTLGATILRNLFLNWVVLLPLLAAALLVPRLYQEIIKAVYVPTCTPAMVPACSVNTIQLWEPSTLVLLLSAVCIVVGFGFTTMNLPSYGNRRQTQGSFLVWCHLPICLGLIGLTLYWSMEDVRITARNILPATVLGPPIIMVVVGAAMGHRWWRPRAWVASAVAGVPAGVIIWWMTKLFAGARVAHAAYPLFAFPLLLVAVNLGVVLFIGVGSKELSDGDVEWYSRFGAWHLITILVWLGAGAIVFGAPPVMKVIRDIVAGRVGEDSATPIFGLMTSVVATAAGILVRILGNGKGGSSVLRRIGIAAAAPTFLLLLLALLSWSNWELLMVMRRHGIPLHLTRPPWPYLPHGLPYVVPLMGVFLLTGLVMGRFVSVNKFSLNGMYRERVIRAFLGASRAPSERRPNPFTGFDPKDDLTMAQLTTTRPMLVVNMTLNTIGQSNDSALHRKAEPFSATPLHVGAAAHGYRLASEYAANGVDQQGLSLGTAVTISGAAASPNMGSFSSPALTFLMTMFNARLGAWLGNPVSTNGSWKTSEPRQSLRPLVDEMLGRTTDTAPYVYLSDGGHFENLGLWQMILRRCRYIIVGDAGCDEDYTFADLANAVRQVRIDLGVPIVFEHGCAIDREHQGNGNPHCAVARIMYSAMDGPAAEDGTLIYVKATLSGDEPIDVLNFSKAHPTFPHESTANQWFDEAHFESYRMLGFHSALAIAKGYRGGGGLPGFVKWVVEQDAVRAASGAPVGPPAGSLESAEQRLTQ